MSIHLLLLFVFPILIPTIAFFFFTHKITWKEWAASIGAGLFAVTFVFCLGYFTQFSDTEILNGEVTGKERRRVSCEHSYQVCVGYTTDSKGNSTPIYETFYEHSHDVDWILHTNLGSGIWIHRINRQGDHEPPRWTAAKIGEPVAMEHEYMNYVKAANESVFSKNKSALSKVPKYPLTIYDYHRINRFVVDNVAVSASEIDKMNKGISEMLKELGPKKQANIVVLLTRNSDVKYIHDVKNAWRGAKKNDIVLVIGAPNFPNILWADVISWSKNNFFDLSLRDDIYNLETFNADNVLASLKKNANEYYVRRSMKEFEYLKHEVEPPLAVLIIAWLLSIGVPVGACVVSYKHDIF